MPDIPEFSARLARPKHHISALLVVWLILALIGAVIGLRLPRDPTVFPPNGVAPKAGSAISE